LRIVILGTSACTTAEASNTLGGLECLVFTGGIGEHSKEIRLQICNRLRWLGVAMDPSATDQAKQCVGARNSEVDILIIPTSEATTIARHCSAKLSGS
jgi:acetate kinase